MTAQQVGEARVENSTASWRNRRSLLLKSADRTMATEAARLK
jgi:hypothetical protein